MTSQSLPTRVLDREFLAIRSRLIDLAAALDRIDRGGGSLTADARVEQIRRSLEILAGGDSTEGGSRRAERIALLFSLPYDPNWRETAGS